MSISPVNPKEFKSEERGIYLIHLLINCANHVTTGSFENANIVLDQISYVACPDGDAIQRVASYFTEALAERIVKTWPGLYKALYSTRITSVSEDIVLRNMFFEFLPFLKVAFVVTNQAIIEAMEGEKMVHIVDLNATELAPWRALLRDLRARPDGPPQLRITGVHQQKEVLDQMAHTLNEDAEMLDVPFQFNPVLSTLENLDIENLSVRTGEATAICSVLQLHSLLACDDDARKKSPPRSSHETGSSFPVAKIDGFLNALLGLSPKIMLLTEQDRNHNGSTLVERLSESLHSYAALFDCLETALPRTSMERFKVEKMFFGEEIKNIIACEGVERKERHEKLEKWIKRFEVAGFRNVPLSYHAILQARKFIQGYNCDGYKIKEESGCVVIYWQDRALFSVSAWRCRR